MKKDSVVCVGRGGRLFLCAIVWALILLPSVGLADLNMWFSNSSSYNASNIWITIQRGQNPGTDVTQASNRPGITYGTNFTGLSWQMYTNATNNPWLPGTYGNLFAESIPLSSMLDSNGLGLLTWSSNAVSAAVYISYGSPFAVNQYTVSGPSANNPSDPNYRLAYQPFEITYGTGAGGAPASGDQGDLTAINYFTASLKIQSFENANATGTPLQESGFYRTGPQMGTTLVGLTASNAVPSEGAEGNAGGPAVITNLGGDVVRVIGPSQFGASAHGGWGYGNYDSFNSYFAGAGSSNALFTNNSAYNTIPNPGPGDSYTNKNVSFAFNNGIAGTTNGYTLNSTGTITVVTTAYTNGVIDGSPVTNAYSNIVFHVNPVAQSGASPVISNIASQFVYLGSYTAFNGGVFTNNDGSPAEYSWFDGTDWTAFTNALSGFVDGSGIEGLQDVTAQVAGEIATGFAAGFVGSTNFGSLPSDQWWGLDPTNAFGGATTNESDYNRYAAAIAEGSSNTVYGMVYSDRFTEASPLINSYQLNGTNVGSWLIGVGDPITAVPEPTAGMLLVLAGAFGLLRRRRLRLSPGHVIS